MRGKCGVLHVASFLAGDQNLSSSMSAPLKQLAYDDGQGSY
jgi:hypothetical protein